MERRLLVSVLLLLLVTVLALAVFRSANRPAETDAALLARADPGGVRSIVIERPGKAAVRFRRQQSHWRMVAPLQIMASEDRIDSMLRLATGRSLARIDTASMPLSVLGLDPPLTILHLDRHSVHFGATDPIDGHRYVLSGNTVHLLRDRLFHQLQQPPVFFASTRLVPAGEHIQAIDFGRQRLVREGEKWALSPAVATTEKPGASELARAWQNGRARRVAEYRPGVETEKIVVTYSSGRRAVFDLLAPAPAPILGRPDLGLRYHLDGEMAGKLFPPRSGPTGEGAAPGLQKNGT